MVLKQTVNTVNHRIQIQQLHFHMNILPLSQRIVRHQYESIKEGNQTSAWFWISEPLRMTSAVQIIVPQRFKGGQSVPERLKDRWSLLRATASGLTCLFSLNEEPIQRRSDSTRFVHRSLLSAGLHRWGNVGSNCRTFSYFSLPYFVFRLLCEL